MVKRALLMLLAACGGGDDTDDGAVVIDAPAAIVDGTDAPSLDAPASAACVTSAGESGDCRTTAACAMVPDHTSIAHACPGPADIQCCVMTPDVADNPPFPTGYRLMRQAEVTPAMTTWAVEILHDPTTYPLYASTTRSFGALDVLARVEWHPPDFNNAAIHRGVTLYVPL